jgi:putative hydrolase of the HAD superfamily
MPLTKPVKAVLLDLDGTLVDTWYAEAEGRAAVARRIAAMGPGIDASAVDSIYREIAEVVWRRALSSQATKTWDGRPVVASIVGSVLDRFDLRHEADPDVLAGLYFDAMRDNYRMYPDAAVALDWLHGRYPLAVVSNGPSGEQRGKLQALDLERRFDAVLISGEVGVGKPQPGIFEAALERLGAGAGEAVHVGDNVGSDVAGALAAGVGAVWLNRLGMCTDPKGPVADEMITSLEELPRLLGQG